MRFLYLTYLSLQTTILFAQADSVKKLSFGAYGEVYYSYDYAKPLNSEKPNFIYNHKRHNEININLFLAQANYSDHNKRANVGLMVGNYAKYNLSLEPKWARNIYEANFGFKLSKKHNLWLDAGIMPSHLGFESAIGATCWTLTRSLLAENSPYYETGLKLGYTNSNEKLNLAFLILNGWQRINNPNFKQEPSMGIQANYKPKENLTFNYSNFIGLTNTNNRKSLRTFHNLYLQIDNIKKLSVIAGFDVGSDKYNSTNYGIWFSPVIILRQPITEKLNVAVRGEYYYDKNQIIVPTNTTNGFQVTGLSSSFDYRFNKKILLRLEGKMFNAKDKIFQDESNRNYALTTSVCIKL